MTWQDKCYKLWGETWKAQLSKMAGLNPRTVRRYAAGEAKIRQELVDKINKTYNIWREE
jgi:ribosome-binding protein aMBF1 (putative translation factor)